MATFNSKFNMDEEIQLKNDTKNNKKSKYCSKCGYENLISSKFCSDCGNDTFYDTLEEYNDFKNSKYCANCKTKLSINTKFCPNCGKNHFVKSLSEIEELELENVSTYWKNQIKVKEETLANLEKKNNELKSKIKNIEKEIESSSVKYDHELANLNTEILNSKNDYASKVNKLELEESKLLSKKSELQTKLNQINDNSSYQESQLKKDIENFTNDIIKLKNENKNLKDQIEQIKKSTNFKLEKVDKEHIYIGRYDGKEILWNILNETKTEMLLITNECVDAAKKDGNEISNFLNSFYQTAFSNAEKNYIIGDVSLLSHSQVLKYMHFKDTRTCGYNNIAKNKAAIRSGLISWWLSENEVVNGKGDFNNTVSTSSSHGLRPVITVKK